MQYIKDDSSCWGIGLGGSQDQKVDLGKNAIPFSDNSFGCVLCIDVLEHVENIHEVFDELGRVSLRYIIVALPNPYADFYKMLRSGNYSQDFPWKFFGLPY